MAIIIIKILIVFLPLHWALLSEFQQLPEDEIEGFLPQICNILIDRDTSRIRDDYAIYDYFEKLLVEKCADCLTFGIRVCGLLKVQNKSLLFDVTYMYTDICLKY